MTVNSALNAVTKFGERFGFPAVVTLIALYLLTQGVYALQRDLATHNGQTTRLLYAICVNLAESQTEMARCQEVGR